MNEETVTAPTLTPTLTSAHPRSWALRAARPRAHRLGDGLGRSGQAVADGSLR